MRRFIDFKSAIEFTQAQLMIYGDDIDPGRWQGVSTEGRPDMVTRELRGVAFTVPMYWPGEPVDIGYCFERIRQDIQPNLPWADDHFEERVSRVPSNPGEQYKNWPWWRGQNEVTMSVDSHDGERFTHTYQERYWPKVAGDVKQTTHQPLPNRGIRYEYGDLDDVVNLLVREPYTRQSYLPIFFPEDTGAVHGGRVPCTLGYQFLYRHKKLHMWYSIRSCDLVRHFRDDLYLSARLLLWVIEEWRSRMDDDTQIDDILPGDFNFVCPSMHVHKGDLHHVQG